MPEWLHDRMQALESAHADLYFPRYGHFQWLRSLAQLAQNISAKDIRDLYVGQNVARRASTHPNAEEIDTKTFANLFLSIQYHAALVEVLDSNADSDALARISVMDWYYGLYWAVNAMLMAQTGQHPEAHRPAAAEFCSVFAERNLLLEPFSYHVTSLVEKEYDVEIAAYGASSKPTYGGYSFSNAQAKSNLIGSLNGSAKWYREREEDQIKDTSGFKALGVTDFRKKDARTYRDNALRKHNCGFLHQAFRARGKANYRDATYLGYGDRERFQCEQFIEDLQLTLNKFLLSAATFCKRKVQKGTWDLFVDDIETNSWFNADSLEPITTAV